MDFAENNRRIAKNTLVLYLRMIIVTLISLYTSRVILRTLGVSDYGVFNVLGGVIGMLGYVNTLLSGAISRFLTFDLGRGDAGELRRTFQISNTLCWLSIAAFLLLGESVGLWFVNNHLNIDESRMYAANWVYHCALASASIVVLQAPFSAAVIAHEKMSAYAMVSVVDAVLKLAVTLSLGYSSTDHLILYGTLLVVVSFVDFFIYMTVCFRHFEESSLACSFEKAKFKAMFSYSGWNMVMVFANILNNYGLNILLNIFYGTVVNAARGLAMQVNSLVTQFYSNFQTASIPQITKYHAQGEDEQMHVLVNNTSKYSAVLLLPVIIPLCFNTTGLLQLWLGEVPEYTAAFVRIMAILSLFAAVDMPVGMGIHAVGRMRLPNLTAAIIYLGIFPITYIAMKMGASAIAGYAVFVITTPFILLADLLILRSYSGFSIRQFLRTVMLPLGFVTVLALIVPVIVALFYTRDNTFDILLKCLLDAIYVITVVFFVAVPRNLRSKLFHRFIR